MTSQNPTKVDPCVEKAVCCSEISKAGDDCRVETGEPENVEVDQSRSSNKHFVVAQVLSVVATCIWWSLVYILDASDEPLAFVFGIISIAAVVILQTMRQNKVLIFLAVAAPVVASLPAFFLLCLFANEVFSHPRYVDEEDIAIAAAIFVYGALWAITAFCMKKQKAIWSDKSETENGSGIPTKFDHQEIALSKSVVGVIVGVPMVASFLCFIFGEEEMASMIAVAGLTWGTIAYIAFYFLALRKHTKNGTSFNYHLVTTEATKDALGPEIPTEDFRRFVVGIFSKYNIKNDEAPESYPDVPEGIEPCLYVSGPRCMCVPYDDKYMVASQVLSVFALLLSWVWWVDLVVSIIAMVLFQIPWCCRQNKKVLFVSVAAAALASMVSVIAWMTFALGWIAYSDVEPFTLDSCCGGDLQFLWATISIVCALLWAGSAYCMFYFATSGKHAKWEEYHANKHAQATRLEASSETTTTKTLEECC